MKKALASAVAGMLVSAGACAAGKGSPAEARAMLDKAMAAVTADEARALAAFNDPNGDYVDRDLYVFCFDKGGKMTASGANPSRVGTDVTTMKGPDGRAVGAEMLALAANGGGQIEYRWMSPTTREVATKQTFVKSGGNQTCAVGAYK